MALDTWMIDATSVRPHTLPLEAAKSGSKEPLGLALGRSRFGLTPNSFCL